MTTPEEQARENIDAALEAAGWVVQDRERANPHASKGVAIREFPLKHPHGFADYLLYVDRQAVGVVEAKPEGETLTGVEPQTKKYSEGMPDGLPRAVDPLPFLYQSTGVETRFTNLLDPEPRSRGVFHFHTPAELADFLRTHPSLAEIGGKAHPLAEGVSSLRGRLQHLPPIADNSAWAGHLWPAQVRAVRNLERSFRGNRPRALIQMATGSGKTYTAITAAYRLIKFADARRVLFLVDRSNLGRQALKEFQRYEAPDDGRKFTDLYNVQHLTSNRLDSVARVAISTIQRVYSMLQGKELDSRAEEESLFEQVPGARAPIPVTYTPHIPIGFFDVIVIDECHRSIYNLWRQVLEYFDAFLVGLTATPSKETFGFFRQNLVMEYSHEEAVVDQVNVPHEVYRIQTRISEAGSTVESGFWVDKRDRHTRRVRWERLEDDLDYDAAALDRKVVAEDQIRTVIRTFRDKLFTEIFPGRREVPKTLIYAKDDSHAEDIVKIVREEFEKGNDFAQKITYKTKGAKPEDLISSFRTAYNPRIAVTVDMIATGTDIKPLEVVMFLRAVRSRNYFDQMKGRGVRVITDDDLRGVTPGEVHKDHYVIVDCVGVTDHSLLQVSGPLERKRSVPFDRLLESIVFGNRDPDVISSLAGRLARLDGRLGEPEREEVAALAGQPLRSLIRRCVLALDPDRQTDHLRDQRALGPDDEPTEKQLSAAEADLLEEAVEPLVTRYELRERLKELQHFFEQTIDRVSQDALIEAGFSEDGKERARQLVASWKQFLEENKDEITALQVLYSRPHHARLRYEDIKNLADAIQAPPHRWTPERLWQAYQVLEHDRVRGAGADRLLTDIVSLVRFALHQEDELVPYREKVEERYQAWLAQQEQKGRKFTAKQRRWLDKMKDHVAASLTIEMEDFDLAPLNQMGGAGSAYKVFGEKLQGIMDELNEVLVA